MDWMKAMTVGSFSMVLITSMIISVMSPLMLIYSISTPSGVVMTPMLVISRLAT